MRNSGMWKYEDQSKFCPSHKILRPCQHMAAPSQILWDVLSKHFGPTRSNDRLQKWPQRMLEHTSCLQLFLCEQLDKLYIHVLIYIGSICKYPMYILVRQSLIALWPYRNHCFVLDHFFEIHKIIFISFGLFRYVWPCGYKQMAICV